MNSQFPIPKSQSIPNSQIPIVKSVKFRRLVIGHWILIGHWLLVIGIYPLFAQGNNQLAALTKQIIEAKSSADAFKFINAVKDLYFKDNKYNELVEFLKSLGNQKKTLEPVANYYIGLARYHQIKHLEAKQNWDEYFANVNTYRQDISEYILKTLDAVDAAEPLSVYAGLLLWQFHRDQLDAFHEGMLTDLVDLVSEYAAEPEDIRPIKFAADKIFSYGEKAKARELYKVYVDKLVNAGLKDDDLSGVAADFYREGNLELAQSVYDIYISRIINSKEKALPVLVSIAQDFSYKDTGLKDEVYAEGIFKKIEDLAGKEFFDEELIYLRAFNLEKMKDYSGAKDYYIELARRFPSGAYPDKTEYKTGVIYAYILSDIKSGRQYFEKLAQKEIPGLYGVLSLYQLGLLSQWEQDYPKAKEYYNKLMEKAKDNFTETEVLAQERIKEIEEGKPMEYNLKAFLDASFKEEDAIFDMAKIDLKASLYNAKAGENINLASAAHIAESGCLQVELQYLWSGDLGQTKPSLQEASFNTSYTQPGTKVINLVVVSPAGIIDRNIDMLDID